VMERPGAIAVVRVAHVIAELNQLVCVLVSSGYTTGRCRRHPPTTTSCERRQTSYNIIILTLAHIDDSNNDKCVKYVMIC